MSFKVTWMHLSTHTTIFSISVWAHCLHLPWDWLCGLHQILPCSACREWPALCWGEILWLPKQPALWSFPKATSSRVVISELLWRPKVASESSWLVCAALLRLRPERKLKTKTKTEKQLKSLLMIQLLYLEQKQSYFPAIGRWSRGSPTLSKDTCRPDDPHPCPSLIILSSFAVNFLSYPVISTGSLILPLLFS